MIKRKFFGNFLSLGIMQGLNYLLPILMIPFLVSKIGLSNVGSSQLFQLYLRMYN
ncbi:hypothetical protein ERHA55_34050 [Erwinia rhapontici]|nr:hypothetical protein ERHA55_34050 [Erwinia rhapontici]